MDFVAIPGHAPPPPPSRPEPYANSPFRTLPPEIKLDIFSHLKDDLKDADQPVSGVTTLAAVSSVCTDFEALVHRSPDMWATAPLRNQDTLQAAIQRSRDRPLSYHVFPPNVPPSGIDAHKAVLDEAWNHIHRVERLSIGANEDSTAYLERSAAPNLVELNACGGSVTAQTFHGETPSSLRVLKLKEYHVASTSPVFGSPQLSDLTFVRCRSNLSVDAQSVLSKIFERIQSSAKNVTVENSSLSLVERADDEADPIPIFLPNVESFHIVDRLDVLGPLLASVVVQPNARVDIVAHLPDGADSPTAYIASLEQVNVWIQTFFAGRIYPGNTMGTLAIRTAAAGTTFVFYHPRRFQEAPAGEADAELATPVMFTFTADFVLPVGPDTAAADEDDDGAPEEEVQLISAGAPVVIGGVVVHAATGMGGSDWSATSSTFNVPHAAQKDDLDWLQRTLGGTLPFVGQVGKLEVDHLVLYTDVGWGTIALYCVRVREIAVVGPAAYGLVTLLGKVDGKASACGRSPWWDRRPMDWSRSLGRSMARTRSPSFACSPCGASPSRVARSRGGAGSPSLNALCMVWALGHPPVFASSCKNAPSKRGPSSNFARLLPCSPLSGMARRSDIDLYPNEVCVCLTSRSG
ncbi:hypothetical protein OF83DRAFT_1138105 [Amylostereum chailletii]|nr:hypothetical protein OF83DRAFT_1138105 [Amylostereum chailletii]